MAPDKPGPTVRIACSLVFSCGTLAVTIVRLLVCMLFLNDPFGWFSLRDSGFSFSFYTNKKKTKNKIFFQTNMKDMCELKIDVTLV